MSDRRASNPGFTLMELLVATTITAIVMAAVYTAFSSSIRLCRRGEANLATYQDARIALGVMRKDVYGMVPHSWPLVEAEEGEFALFTVVTPMDVEEGEYPRVMQVAYRLKRDQEEGSRILVREERIVEGPLPRKAPGDDSAGRFQVETGRKKTFELAGGVDDMEITYLWTPVPEERTSADRMGPPEPVEPIEREVPPDEWGQPQAIRIALTMADPVEEDGETTFTTVLTFPGAAPSVSAEEDL